MSNYAPEAREAAAPTSGLIDAVTDWLMTQSLAETEIDDVLRGCCERLYAAGVPLWRAHLTFRVLHPLYEGFSLVWRNGRPIEIERFKRQQPVSDMYLRSPHYHMIENGLSFLRRRLRGDDTLLDFPILEDLRAEGATDYFAYTVEFGSGTRDGIAGSWATTRDSGFTERDIAALMRIRSRLAVACKMRIRTQVARNVVTTYLGAGAGLRVLDGQIARGDGETIHAVIWYSDLRDFTRMTDTMERDAYLAVLNRYFECVAQPVLDKGGEILSFIGDAVLAIFPIRKGTATPRQAARKALAAAAEAERRLDAANAERQATGAADAGDKGDAEPLVFGLALHIGDVQLGNIGVAERLSFSVIGPTVNEVARLERLTKELDRPVLVSGAFARSLPGEWDPLGKHSLPGVGTDIEVFAPPARRDAA